jgi:ACS family pantothenate transporter-like MFS transporter
LIGAGTSSTDIARDLGPIAKTIYQSSRNGLFDLTTAMLPENGVRIGEISSLDAIRIDEKFESELQDDEPLPSTVTLKSGQKLCNIHTIIICTGYHFTLPFLNQYHEDDTKVAEASEQVLVTDGTQVHNLHKDIWYIPDPSLIFVGIPFFTATFSLFDFQAIAVAAVLSGRSNLPSQEAMRKEYNERVEAKGYGRFFHSLLGKDVEYVNELLDWINEDRAKAGREKIQGHSKEWHQAKVEHMERVQALFGGTRLLGGGEDLSDKILELPICV